MTQEGLEERQAFQTGGEGTSVREHPLKAVETLTKLSDQLSQSLNINQRQKKLKSIDSRETGPW